MCLCVSEVTLLQLQKLHSNDIKTVSLAEGSSLFAVGEIFSSANGVSVYIIYSYMY